MALSAIKQVTGQSDRRTCVRARSEGSSRMRCVISTKIRARHQSLFEHITKEVDTLHALMRRYGAVLGGSAVLQMVCPIFDDVNDYDFFVPVSYVEELVAHFVNVDGYQRKDEQTYPRTNGCTIGDCRYLSGIASQVTLALGQRKIDVIGVGAGDDWDFVLVPIASSWTTALFNYATADWIEVAYPSLTLRGRGLVQWERANHWTFPGGTRIVELEKYVKRGFEFRTHADDWDVDSAGHMKLCRDSWVCPLMTRGFGDGGCLRIVVGRDRDVVENNAVAPVKWKFGAVRCPEVCDTSNPQREQCQVHVVWCACM